MKNRIALITTLVSALIIHSVHSASAAESSKTALKNTNISISPLGLLIGSASVEADFGVTENIAIGPNLQYSKLGAGTNIGFGVDAVFFLGHPRFTDSWFVSPFVGYATTTNSLASASGLVMGANLGYWWFWESGVNLGLGLGLQYLSINLASIGLGSIPVTLPSAIAQFGYAF